jgi:hypothetical protein
LPLREIPFRSGTGIDQILCAVCAQQSGLGICSNMASTTSLDSCY